MARLLVHVEGQTEETFVNEVLGPHLRQYGYESVSARLLGNARARSNRGGVRAWNAVRKDILNHLREDQSCLATTMVDYYAMPKSGSEAWPGRSEASNYPFARRAETVEAALLADINQNPGGRFNPDRFIPFVLMHEFEALLFSDCRKFGSAICQPALTTDFQQIRDQFGSPEEINDSPQTAPSKRIEQLFPAYEKVLYGNLAILEIGLETIRRECPHFHQWIERLEQRPQAAVK
jgi:hypothetical protein